MIGYSFFFLISFFQEILIFYVESVCGLMLSINRLSLWSDSTASVEWWLIILLKDSLFWASRDKEICIPVINALFFRVNSNTKWFKRSFSFFNLSFSLKIASYLFWTSPKKFSPSIGLGGCVGVGGKLWLQVCPLLVSPHFPHLYDPRLFLLGLLIFWEMLRFSLISNQFYKFSVYIRTYGTTDKCLCVSAVSTGKCDIVCGSAGLDGGDSKSSWLLDSSEGKNKDEYGETPKKRSCLSAFIGWKFWGMFPSSNDNEWACDDM